MRLFFGSGKLTSVINREGDIIVSHAACDVTDRDSVIKVIKEYQPSVVINAAAKTNLEYCEENKEIAYLTNTLGPLNILSACATHAAKFIHISSGCLFDGNSAPATEATTPNTSVWYTHTKKWADEMITAFGYEDYLILRPRQMISALDHPTNMLTKFAQYENFFAHQELNSITCVEDFGEMIDHLVKTEQRGMFNCCNDGVLTPYEIALGVKTYINPKMEVHEATYEHTLTLQRNRRVNTILDNKKLKKSGYSPRSAAHALEWCLINYAGGKDERVGINC